MVENAFGILVSQFRVLLGKGQGLSGSVYICDVAQHAEDIPGRSRQGTNPSK